MVLLDGRMMCIFACKFVCSNKVLICTTYATVHIFTCMHVHVLVNCVFKLYRSEHKFTIFCYYFTCIALLHAMVVILLNISVINVISSQTHQVFYAHQVFISDQFHSVI